MPTNPSRRNRFHEAGADGLIVSNHGGRQLDAAEPSINTVAATASAVGDRVVVMADSGVGSGPDIAKFKITRTPSITTLFRFNPKAQDVGIHTSSAPQPGLGS